MGFNSIIMIYNDELDRLENNEHLGKNIGSQLSLHVSNMHNPYGTRGFKVVAQHHADNTSVILVGQNTHKVIGMIRGHWDWAYNGDVGDSGVVNILKQLAADYGYRLLKKHGAKPNPYRGRGLAF